MRWARTSKAKGLLLALYALVAISLVFAQRCLRIEQPINHIDLAAFALPGGDIPTLCNGKADSAGGTDEHDCKACETCAVSTAPQIAASNDSAHAPANVLAAVIAMIPEDARAAASAPDNVRSRAPPGQLSLA